MSGLAAWLEERIGYGALVRASLDTPIAGGPRARYVFGSLLVFLFANQAITGFLLALGYAPSVHDAWPSVAYIQEVAPLGWFIRGMHSAGASVTLCVAVLHLAQVTWAGAYRRPRELTWWLGLALLGLLFAFSLTGYLLPWDQKGYAGTQVATGLLALTPVVGEAARRVVQGGASCGNLTLTHFYAGHVLLLPASFVALVLAHFLLFRRHGVTVATSEASESRPFYPRQATFDLGAATLAAIVLVLCALRGHGAELGAPADPTVSAEVRPEWYFLPLFQLLRHVPQALEVVVALGAPLLVFGSLAVFPFLGRTSARRRLPIAIVAALVLGAAALGAWAKLEDRRDAAFVAGRARTDRAALAARLRFRARLGVGRGDPVERTRLAEALFADRCASCHTLGGGGGSDAPALDAWSSRAWIDAFLGAPDDARFFGHTRFHDMKPVTLTGDDRAALVEWIWSQGGGAADAAKVARGAEVYAASDCGDCHERDGTSDGHGIPNLGGRASEDWLRGLIRDAGGARYFGKKNAMPRFGDELSDLEIDALASWLRARR